MKYALEPGALVCTGELAFTQDRITAQDYPAFRAFVSQVDQAFGRKVSIRAPQKGAEPQRTDLVAPSPAPALATGAAR